MGTRASSAKHPRPRSTEALIVGALASLALMVTMVIVAAVENARVERLTFTLAERRERSSFLAGNVGEQLARLRANVAVSLTRPPEALPPVAARITKIRATLESLSRELPETLPPEELKLWMDVRPEVERLEQDFMVAFALVRAGDRTRAAQILEQDVAAVSRVHELLDVLERSNEARLLADIDSARHTVARVRLFEMSLGGLFVLGTLVIWLVVLRRMRHQERVLADYTARIEVANDDLDAFAGRVAHDLRNALSPVVMGATLLGCASNDRERVLFIAERIKRSSLRSIKIIEGLLEFSQAGKVMEVNESSSVQESVRGVLDELEPLITRMDVTVETSIPEDVHPRCPEALLHMVLANICGNSVKFLKRRSERRIFVSARSCGSWCVIEVEDTGPGIPEDSRERIFEPFYRVPGSHAPGAGIGLATVHRLVAACGGDVSVDSSEGHGARFVVRLPRAERPSDRLEQAPPLDGYSPALLG